VDELELEGVESLDPYALRACLATRERESLSIDLSASPSPTCGKEPFDGQRIHLALWRWPWKDWPLYDPSVFERDLARIERWYRARGFYGARVLDSSADPESALYGTPPLDPDENEIRLRVRLEEGDPVLVSAVSIDGIDALERDLASKLLALLDDMEPAERFDEATFDRTKQKLLRTLRDAGYAAARVESEATVDPEARTAQLDFHVVSGAFSELGDVCVEGHGSLPPKLILQASDLVPGRAYSETELEDARTRIYQMRVFSEVEIIAGRVDPDTGASLFGREGGAERQGEWLAFGSGGEAPIVGTDIDPDAMRTERVCHLSTRDSVRPRIPIEIRVKPSKLYRFGVGAGIQIGVEDGQRAYSAAQQWDTHLFTYLELRNFLGGLRRFRIEERPKLVFPAQFPSIKNEQGERDYNIGNNLSTLFEWPAFLEARTLLRLTAVWDRGPDPFGGGFIRDDINVGIGPSRGFLRNRLNASFSFHINPYIPKRGSAPEVEAERYRVLFLQQALEWDDRDDRYSPRRGTYARLEIHETLPGSNWSYVRLTPELRRYIPLPYGLVLAGRAGIGLIHIYGTNAKTNELRRLGPRPYRLRGGGPYSVRGVAAGQLGLRDADLPPEDAVQTDPSTQRLLLRGFPGGTRSWIASLELRVPLGESFGIAGFMDAGDVDGGYGTTRGSFRFNRPNTTLGAGLRYKTLVGPLRLDFAWLVPGLQGDTSDARRVDRRDPLFGIVGAVHLTIGEAF
jgi:outer membrane translocation and assembly module TamA